MGLLDLPIELFRPIIRDVVGCPPWTNTDVISLARVNTVLEFEVFQILEEAQFLTSNGSRPTSTFDLHPEYVNFIARYVIFRPYQDIARWNDHFPALVDATLDAIIKLHPKSTPRRAHMVTTLCRKASLHLLVSKTVGDLSRREFNDHLFVAATHLKQLPIIAALLAQNPDLNHTHSDFFGSPIQAAIAIDDANLVRRFLLHGAAFEYAGWLKDVVRARHSAQLLAVLVSQKKVVDVLRVSLQSVTSAVADAIELGKQDVAIALLQTQDEAFGHGSLSFYLRKAVFAACKNGMNELLVLLIEAGAFIQSSAWTGPSLRHLLVAACKVEDVSVLHLLLTKTKGLKTGVSLEDILVQAARTGTTAALRVLLEHGVRLGPQRAFNLLVEVAPWPPGSEPPNKDISATLHHMIFLLDHKAIPPYELHTVNAEAGFGMPHLMMVAAQRGNLKLLEALARFKFPIDDGNFYAKAGCAVPIVAAEAYGQAETAAGLRALLVERERERAAGWERALRVVEEKSALASKPGIDSPSVPGGARVSSGGSTAGPGRGGEDYKENEEADGSNAQIPRPPAVGAGIAAALASPMSCRGRARNPFRIQPQDPDDDW